MIHVESARRLSLAAAAAPLSALVEVDGRLRLQVERVEHLADIDALELETGDGLLLEAGGYILLEAA